MIEGARSRAGVELAEDLAGTLRAGSEKRIVWTEVVLEHGGRADVLAIRPWQSKLDLAVYEVKISRGDFFADVNADKFRKYEPSCHRLYFATPQGLVRKAEVPEGCGLITRGANGWRVVKPPKPRQIAEPSFSWMVGLLERTWEHDAPAARRLRQKFDWESNAELKPRMYQFAERVREGLYRLEYGREATAEERNALEVVRELDELLVAAGVKPRRGSELFDGFSRGRLLEHAVEALKAADEVRRIGEYLAHFWSRAELDLPDSVRDES